jgi:hypothetical protein
MKNIVRNSIVGIALSASTFTMYAQTEVFKVLASRGFNTLVDGSAIFAGKKLNATDVIKVGNSSYLGLIHNTGKTVEVKEPGTYKVSELSAKLLSKSSSITKKYSDYVIGELTKTENGDIHSNYQKNMKVTGSVERAISSASLALCLPKTSAIIDPVNSISWYKNSKATSYIVEVTDMTDEVLFSKETTDTTLVFDVNSFKPSPDKTLLINVKANGELVSDRHVLKRLVETKNPDIYAERNILNKEYTEENALSSLMKASFYAQNNMFIDAKKYFETAIKLEPEVSEYKEAYKTFLAKNKLSDFYPYGK